MGTKIILGSASPRRRELLSQIGIGFTVRVSDKEEVYHSEVPEEIVKELALMKAENVATEIFEEQQAQLVREEADFVVIGADTVVVLDQKILGETGGRGGCLPDAEVSPGQGRMKYIPEWPCCAAKRERCRLCAAMR